MQHREIIFAASAVLIAACLAAPAKAVTIFAEARANFQETTAGNTTATFNGGQGLSDTFGSGRWNYYESDNPNLDATANELLVVFGQVGAPLKPGYGGGSNSGGESDSYNLPAVADESLFGGSLAADQLSVHPADGNGVGAWIVLRWMAGAGETGLANIAGIAENLLDGTNTNGTDFQIRYNGSTLLHQAIIGKTAAPASAALTSFNLNQAISPGDTIDFVVGNNGQYYNDQTHFSATISIPEPSSLALLLCGAASLNLILRKKRSPQRAESTQVRFGEASG
jgi:hypothetical protein